jgi:2-isopropylmalate synthase
MEDVPEVHHVEALDVSCGSDVSVATLAVSLAGGPPRWTRASGDGPIAAAFAAAEQLVGLGLVLEDLHIRAATPGRDALGEVVIRASVAGGTFTGRGAATDVVRASLEAYFHVVNKVEAARSQEGRPLARLPEPPAVEVGGRAG